MNLERHDISIKASEEEGFDIYILYHPSVCTRSAIHDQPEEFSEVEVEGVYYDENNHKLSAEHMARLPLDKADLLDVKEVDWSDSIKFEKIKCNCCGRTHFNDDQFQAHLYNKSL
jgi:hypothetical protein